MNEQQNSSIDTKRYKTILLVFVLLILGAGGYFAWLLVKANVLATAEGLENTVLAVKQLQIKQEQLQISLKDLQDTLEKSNISQVNNWKPVIIEHLVQLANLTLGIKNDPALALDFLLTAKQYANDPELSAINLALTQDMARLQVAPKLNTEELILKIEIINQKIDSLSLTSGQFIQQEKTQATEQKSIYSFWQRFLSHSLKALRDMVVIHRRTVEPLLAPEQETVLRLNLQTKLFQAELAVMQHQNKLYQLCLEDVSSLIKHYFATNKGASSDILSALQELQGIDLQPQLPPLTESLHAVKNFLNATGEPKKQQSQTNKALEEIKTP